MYLLDTNIISEMRKIKHGKADAKFTKWLSKVDANLFYTSVISTMELERGILAIERKDPAQAEALRKWKKALMGSLFTGRVLSVDEDTALVCASLHIPNKAPENDAWIAALALQHGLTLVTRNTKDFEHEGLKVINPFGVGL